MTVPTIFRDWRRILVLGGVTGAGFALALLLTSPIIDWYRSRPRPWNTTAIRASFVSIDTEGVSDTLVFYYVVENTTRFDYEVADKSEVVLTGKTHTEKALAPEDEYETMKFPLFIPTKGRLRVGIHLPYPYEDKCTEQMNDAATRRAEGSLAFVPDVPSETIETLAQRIRGKLKACDSYEANELVQVVIRKFPAYRDWLTVEDRQKLRSERVYSQKRLDAFVNEEMPNLEGFVLFDKKNRVQIDFPKGW